MALQKCVHNLEMYILKYRLVSYDLLVCLGFCF